MRPYVKTDIGSRGTPKSHLMLMPRLQLACKHHWSIRTPRRTRSTHSIAGDARSVNRASKSIEIRAGTYRGGIARDCHRFAAHCRYVDVLYDDPFGCENEHAELGHTVSLSRKGPH